MSETEIIQETATGATGQEASNSQGIEAKVETGTDKAAVEQVKDAAKNDDPDFSRKFAALSKRQQALFIKEQELKQRESKYSEIDKLEALREQDPLGYLQKKGLNLDQILQHALKQGEPETADDRVAKLEKTIQDYLKQQETDKQKAEAEAKRRQEETEREAIDSFKKKIETDLKADPDKYEVINAQNAYHTVFEVIEENFEKTGKVMTVTDAAELVENYLLEGLKKLTSLKKLGIKPETKAFDPTIEAALEQYVPSTVSQPAPTLKSTMTPTATANSGDKLSFEERMEKARQLLLSQGFR